MPYLDSDSPPPLSEGDTHHRSDTGWEQAAQTYIQARQRSEEAAATLDAARAALMSLANHPREQGAGVTVTRYWKQGNIDYKRIPQLLGVDLEPYRKKGGEEVRVTVSG